MILQGSDKPLADMSIWMPIKTAPKDRPVTGGFISKTGKLMHKCIICWHSPLSTIDDDDCPINDADWQGWIGGGDCFLYPSHWKSDFR